MCTVGILFTSEGMMEHETERRIGRCIGRGEERAEPKGEALNLLVSLCSYPHLWSWTLGRDRKNKIPDTSGWNEFPLQGGGALPCSARRHKQGNSNMELDKITFTDTRLRVITDQLREIICATSIWNNRASLQALRFGSKWAWQQQLC